MAGTNKQRVLHRFGLVVLLVGASLLAGCRNNKHLTSTVEASPINPMTAAVHKVEEQRGEPVGRQAIVNVPRELKHYADRRRFLAIQLAEWRKHRYEVPRDFEELVRLIQRGELVEVEPVTEDYVLYGVGEQATDDFFSHYDADTRKDVPLYSTLEEFRNQFNRLNNLGIELRARSKELKSATAGTARRNRKGRKALVKQLSANNKKISAVDVQKELIASYYLDRNKIGQLSGELRVIADLASDFGGRSYDLTKAEERRLMKIRLLSFLRPAARDILLEIAHAYRTTFDRPLPITSLVRTGDYQRLLHKTNRNASSSSIPPHTTGLAFDVYSYYMSAGEQEYLMSEIVRLEAQGRIEALRERRDHIHVFAFIDGSRPDEALINPNRHLKRLKARSGLATTIRQPAK